MVKRASQPRCNGAVGGLCLVAVLAGTVAVGHASEPEYLTHRGPLLESPKQADTAIDDLGRPNAPPAPEQVAAELPDAVPALTPWSWINDSTLKVQIRSYYLERDRDGAMDSLAWALGGSANYQSGMWRDRVGLGATFYTSQPVYAPKDKPGSGLLAPVQNGYSVLGESYLLVRPFGTSYLRLWRQGLELPYINKHDIRMTPNTHQAYLLFDKDDKRFNYVLGYVGKIRKRTETTWRSMSDAAGAAGTNKGVSMFGGRYKFGDHARIGAINQYGYDTFNTFYAEATGFTRPLAALGRGSGDGTGLEARGSLQYTNQQSVGNALLGRFNTWQFGAKLDLGTSKQTLTLAYTQTGEGAGIQKPWGGTPSYNSVIVEDFDSAGERAWRIGAAFDLARVGLHGVSGFVNYVVGDTPDSGANASVDKDELDFTLDWRPKDARLKGLWLRARVASINAAGPGAVDQMDYRLILNYDFSLL
jgi:hypothetical protein